MVKSTGCPASDPGSILCTHVVTHHHLPSVSLVPDNVTPASGLLRHQTCTQRPHTVELSAPKVGHHTLAIGVSDSNEYLLL